MLKQIAVLEDEDRLVIEAAPLEVQRKGATGGDNLPSNVVALAPHPGVDYRELSSARRRRSP
eukprot:5711530-Alexandrium_andersonii.AAC.1